MEIEKTYCGYSIIFLNKASKYQPKAVHATFFSFIRSNTAWTLTKAFPQWACKHFYLVLPALVSLFSFEGQNSRGKMANITQLRRFTSSILPWPILAYPKASAKTSAESESRCKVHLTGPAAGSQDAEELTCTMLLPPSRKAHHNTSNINSYGRFPFIESIHLNL